jgi:hypothetical protein
MRWAGKFRTGFFIRGDREAGTGGRTDGRTNGSVLEKFPRLPFHSGELMGSYKARLWDGNLARMAF